jgi:hypothetical protein
MERQQQQSEKKEQEDREVAMSLGTVKKIYTFGEEETTPMERSAIQEFI